MRFYQKGDENRLDLADEKFLSVILDLFSPLEIFHNYRVTGLEHIPETKGFVLISNHAFIAYDILFFMRKYHQLTGKHLKGITDHSIFKIPILRDIFLKMGIIDGTFKNASKILKNNFGLIIYPGGAREAMKPSQENYQLRWQGRYGFIKLAMENSVPLLPLVSKGNDDIFKVYFDGYSLKLKDFPLPFFRGIRKTSITHKLKPPIYLKNDFKDDIEKKLYIRRKQRELKSIFEDELLPFII